MRRSRIIVAALLVPVLCPAVARSDIIGVGGAAVIAEPPASIANNHWESNTEIRCFFERQTMLGSSLGLDHVTTGLVNGSSLLAPGSVAAGTTVQSYLVHADSVAAFSDLLSGYITFDTPILGVLVNTQSLVGSDGLLGRPGITYGDSSARGLELQPAGDFFAISADRTRLDFTLKFETVYDELRIVTAVPEPATLAMLFIPGLLYCRRRRA